MVESKTLYRKYRGRSFSEIVGQDHITKTLEQALQSGRISHAYLLTGPHGVGKTSVARILAHRVNDLPYDEESTHLDIIEIDAASNRRIDEIRDLRDKVNTAPTSAKFKVYIIDEVHMLTKEAFNALLKTLEEPPEHVIFILATTEAHKLPATIISRTQQHTFRPISEEQAAKHLRSIADKEAINIDDQALKLIAEQGAGSFRDSIGILDRVSQLGEGKITAEDIRSLIGQAPEQLVIELKESIFDSPAAISSRLEQAFEYGVVPAILASQLSQLLRTEYIAGKYADRSTAVLKLIDQLGDVSRSYDPKIKLETSLFRANLETTGPREPIEHTPKSSSNKSTDVSEQKPEKKAEEPPRAATSNKDTIETVSTAGYSDIDEAQWLEIINLVKQENNTLYAALRMAKPDMAKSTLRLRFKFPFHQSRVASGSNLTVVTQASRSVLGDSFKVETAVDKSIEVMPPSTVEAPQDASVDRVVDAFGGGEVVAI